MAERRKSPKKWRKTGKRQKKKSAENRKKEVSRKTRKEPPLTGPQKSVSPINFRLEIHALQKSVMQF